MSARTRPWRAPLLVVAALAALSFVAIEPPPPKEAAVTTNENGSPLETIAPDDTLPTGEVDPNSPSATTPDGKPKAPGATVPGTKTTTRGAAQPTPAGVECKAGKNGGATAKGVTGNRIKLAATNVRSGTGASFLGTSFIGMQAVVNRVNAKGGICGRLLDLRLVDDGWDAPRGANYLGTFAKEDIFALPVVPSSEGLTLAITNGTIDDAKIPVVGTDGMLKEQYSSPWVWPVATSTVSTMRIMTKYAADNGAKTFGIVYDAKYKFGLEGKKAFEEYVRDITGKPPLAMIPLQPGQGNYSGDAKAFNDKCNPACDFVAMLLTPVTAATYINSQPQIEGGKRRGFGAIMTGGAQPLFNERFARDCKAACDGMLVWTGYNPPIGGLASNPDVAAYVDDVQSVDPQVDVNNQFLQGAYLGMKVFVASLEKAGPFLTRDGVKAALDSMTYQSGLSSPLSWTNTRFANLSAQPFRITTASGDFLGFAEVGTGFIKDPQPGKVPAGE